MSRHIKRIKLYISLLAVVVIGAFFVGISLFSSSKYMQGDYFRNRLNYLRYKIEYAGGSGFLAAQIQSFDAGPRIYRSSDEAAPSIPILVYHGLLDKDDDSGGLNTTVDKFKDQMFTLKRAGFETITTEDLLRYMKGEMNLPPKSFMLTFDDGRRDSYIKADPILQALEYEAVMFIITHYSIDQDTHHYIDANELKAMNGSGRWDIQVHTHNGHGMIPIDAAGTLGNFFSNKMWLAEHGRLETDDEYEERVSRDLAIAKSRLEELLGKQAVAFAFPFGDFGQGPSNYAQAEQVLIAQAAPLYEIILYQQAPGEQFHSNYRNELTQSRSSFLLRRMDYNRMYPEAGSPIAEVVKNAAAKLLPYTDVFETDLGWIKAWGDVAIGNGSLRLDESQVDKTGSATILDGSGHWRDYLVSATTNSPTGSGVFLWIRFRDEFNNAACNFGNGFAHVEQVVNGEKRVIKGVREPYIRIPSSDFMVTARVEGRKLECSIEGLVTVSTEFLDPSLNQGGIGWKTWKVPSIPSGLIVRNLRVDNIAEVPGGSLPATVSNAQTKR